MCDEATTDTSSPQFSISDEAMRLYTWVVYGVVCQFINIFGICTNIISIICFAKQGFEDPFNISLLGLSVSDLGSFVTMLFTCIGMTPAFLAADLEFDQIDVTYLTAATPHLAFTRVSSCLTAWITLERCVCITSPLMIKSLITRKRATVITVHVFIIFYFTSAPVYAVNKLGRTFSPLRNKTLIGLISSEDRDNVESVSFFVNSFAIPFSAFVIIVVCMTILSVKLQRQSKWRQKAITCSTIDIVSSRNLKVAKMVVMISILFIVCFLPMNTAMIAFGLMPEMTFQSSYVNILIIVAGVGYTLESINSSMNIFIYYHMSTKYRDTFVRIFYRQIKMHV